MAQWCAGEYLLVSTNKEYNIENHHHSYDNVNNCTKFRYQEKKKIGCQVLALL